jgi:molecular chaperone GrpE
MGKNFGPSADLENAMAEALASVEAREKTQEEPEVEVEAEAPDERPGDEAKGADSEAAGEGEDVAGLKDQLLRLAADFQNFRKRATREMDEARRHGSEKVLLGLLPVLDNLERAVSHSGQDDSPIAEGVRMVAKQFVDVLGTFGVTGFESVGEPFDPERHEAMSQVVSEDFPPGAIVEQMLKGYLMHDRLLRPAQVIVAAAPARQAEDEAAGEGEGEDV